MSSEHGDKKTVWNPDNADEVEAARREFDYLVKEKKYSAFVSKDDGSQGKRIDKFNPELGRMILVPQLVGG